MTSVTTPTVRPGIAGRLSQMIRIPTVSAELDERGPAPFEEFVALIAELYPLTHRDLRLERHTDFGLLFHWAGSGAAGRDPLVLMAHYDVVPVDESDAWTYPPFAGTIADGSVYGRGALDDKGPLLVVLEAVENLLADGFVPSRDVYLSFGGNEETYGKAAEEIARVLRARGVMPWLVLDEGGAVVDAPLPFVPGRAAMIGVGEKGVMTLRLAARGEGGHASAPPSLTAVRRVARAVDRLGPATFRPRASKAILRMLSQLATRTPGPARHLLSFLGSMPLVTAQVFAALGVNPPLSSARPWLRPCSRAARRRTCCPRRRPPPSTSASRWARPPSRRSSGYGGASAIRSSPSRWSRRGSPRRSRPPTTRSSRCSQPRWTSLIPESPPCPM